MIPDLVLWDLWYPGRNGFLFAFTAAAAATETLGERAIEMERALLQRNSRVVKFGVGPPSPPPPPQFEPGALLKSERQSYLASAFLANVNLSTENHLFVRLFSREGNVGCEFQDNLLDISDDDGMKRTFVN